MRRGAGASKCCNGTVVDQGRAAFVVLAGGSGTRVGGELNKVYLPLAGRPVIAWSLAWAREVPEVGPVVLVIRPEDAAHAAHAVEAAGLEAAGLGSVAVVTGGSTRHRSEQAALDHLTPAIEAGELDVVVIHDGARPLAGARLLRTVIRTAAEHGGAVPTIPETTAWPLADGALHPPAAGISLHRVQTPQAFRAKALLDAYAEAARTGIEGTDTAAAFEEVAGIDVIAVPGSPDNLKVTFAPDLLRADALLGSR
jgi:2-C-methyl-D-erythritol 4-phosphate cytidylyltransferase